MEAWADPPSAALPVSSEPCAFTSTQHLCAQPSMKGVSCSMSMLKGKGLLSLLGMNLFERGQSPGGQGSFATSSSPRFCKKRGDRLLQDVSFYVSTDKAENSAVHLSGKPGGSSCFRLLHCPSKHIMQRKVILPLRCFSPSCY